MKKIYWYILILPIFFISSCKKEFKDTVKTDNNSLKPVKIYNSEEYTPSDSIAVDLVTKFFKDRYNYINSNPNEINPWNADQALWTLEASANYAFTLRSNGAFDKIEDTTITLSLAFYTDEEENIMVLGTDMCHTYSLLKLAIENITSHDNLSISVIDQEYSINHNNYILTYKIVYGVKSIYGQGCTPIPLSSGAYSSGQVVNQFKLRWTNAFAIHNIVSLTWGDPYYEDNIYANVYWQPYMQMDFTDYLWAGGLCSESFSYSYWNVWLWSGWDLLNTVQTEFNALPLGLKRILLGVDVYCDQLTTNPADACHSMKVTSGRYISPPYAIQTY